MADDLQKRQLLMLKGAISDLPQAQQEKINACVAELHAVWRRYDADEAGVGVFAIGKMVLEFHIEMEK